MAAQFENTLLRFEQETEKNHFFSSGVYALAHLQRNEKPADFFLAANTIGQEKFLKLKEIEKDIMLDYTQFGFFNPCMKLNDLLAKEFGFFLIFYETTNKFHYQLRQKLKSKNEVRAERSSCVIQKFNGYNLLRTELCENEKKNPLPLDIVYKPTQDKNKPICYLAPKIHLAFQSVYEKLNGGKKISIKCSSAKQCPYCINFFVKSEKRMQEHILCYAGQAGFSFSFDNGKIIIGQF